MSLTYRSIRQAPSSQSEGGFRPSHWPLLAFSVSAQRQSGATATAGVAVSSHELFDTSARNQPTKGETMNNMKFVKAHGGYYQWVPESDPRPEWRPALIRLLNAVVARWGWVVTRRRE